MTDDLLRSTCGVADGTLDHFPCCHVPVHENVMGFALVATSDMGDSEECVVCRCVMAAHDRFTLPCCSYDLHLDCVVRSCEVLGALCALWLLMWME